MTHNPNLDTTDWDWAIDPTGLEYIFRDIYTRYNKPLMITENGLGAFDTLTEDGKIHDEYRIEYLREHIKAMKRAMDYGDVYKRQQCIRTRFSLFRIVCWNKKEFT